MQRILISLIIAVVAGMSAKITLATTGTPALALQTAKNHQPSTTARFITNRATHAQAVATTTPTRTATPRAQTTQAPTSALTATVPITRLRPITAQVILTTPMSKATPISTTPKLTVTVPLPTPTPDPAATDAAYTGAITGTIIANRTEARIRFFVEGATYTLDPLRSLGLALPRATSVLNLYNCDAGTPESKDCFWDPYLLDKDSFYEIVKGSDAGKTVGLSLRPAGAPPTDRVWVQNRTGRRETIFYADKVYEIPPSSVQEFPVEQNAPTILLNLRNCVTINSKSACEWSPHNAEPGYYYALVENSAPGQVKDSTISTLSLQSILAPEGTIASKPSTTATATTTTTAETASATPNTAAPASSGAIVCHLQVPIVNIRSGPGLQYQVIGQVSSNGQAAGTVNVIGRDATQQWVAIDNKEAPGGWMTASPGFMECEGDLAALPVAQIIDGRLEPTPAPQVAAPAGPGATGSVTNTAGAPVAEQSSVTPTVAAPVVPDGQALLIVNNGFDQPIRFTLDQIYRVEQGPSEFDLQPGQGINIFVRPGQIAFSASSAWRGLADNKEFFLDNKQTRILWIVFVPSPDGSGRWLLQF